MQAAPRSRDTDPRKGESPSVMPTWPDRRDLSPKAPLRPSVGYLWTRTEYGPVDEPEPEGGGSPLLVAAGITFASITLAWMVGEGLARVVNRLCR